jgi:hypothetical protein
MPVLGGVVACDLLGLALLVTFHTEPEQPVEEKQ